MPAQPPASPGMRGPQGWCPTAGQEAGLWKACLDVDSPSGQTPASPREACVLSPSSGYNDRRAIEVPRAFARDGLCSARSPFLCPFAPGRWWVVLVEGGRDGDVERKWLSGKQVQDLLGGMRGQVGFEC